MATELDIPSVKISAALESPVENVNIEDILPIESLEPTELSQLQILGCKLESYENGVILKRSDISLDSQIWCGYENVYNVYKKNSQGGKFDNKKRLKYKGTAKFWENCLTDNCRPITLSLSNTNDNEVVQKGRSECKCSYYCCNKQQVLFWTSEKYGKGKNQVEEKFIGKIHMPWNCCGFEYQIYDNTSSEDSFGDLGNIDFTVHISCCHLYFWCQCTCQSCMKISYEISDGNDEIVGNMVRTHKDFQKSYKKWDEGISKMSVDFPKESNWRQRGLLMTLGVYIDWIVYSDLGSGT